MTSRYSDVFSIKKATDTIPSTGIILDRVSDIYITYNSADRLDLISNRVYGDSKYWWVILLANGYSIEFDIEDGEVLRIPYPLQDVLSDIRKSINGRS